MATKHISFLLALIFLCNFDKLTEVLAKRRKSQVSDDDSLVVSARYDEDSLEDESESRSLEDDKRIRRLKDQVKESQDDLRSLTENKIKLWDELEDCLNKLGDNASGGNKPNGSESGGTKSKDKKSKGVDKCRSSAKGCDSDNTSESVSQDSTDDNHQDNSDEEEGIMNSLLDKIHRLNKKKIPLKKEIRHFTRNLNDCKDSLKRKRKKFRVYTVKVPWHTAKSLCEIDGKQLASITSWRDQLEVSYARMYGDGVTKRSMWIGGYRDLSSFFWKGKNGSIPFTYTNWLYEPTWKNDNEKCVQSQWYFSYYQWSVSNCDEKFSYACEYYEY